MGPRIDRGRQDNLVSATGFGLVKRFVGCFQGVSGVLVRKDIRNPAGKRDPTNGIVIGAVDELATTEILSDSVELLPGLLGGLAPEQHDKFLAAMPCDMTSVVRDPGKSLTDRLDDPVPGVVPMGVVDALEMIDVAECDAQVVGLLASFAVMTIESRLKCAPVWQTGKVVNLSVMPGFVEFPAKRLRLVFAALHFCRENLGP